MKIDQQLDAQLCDLWARRSELNEAEWTRLYEIVTGVLKANKPRILASLPGEHEDYVYEYFSEKVYRFDLASQCHHAGALSVFYRRFLEDKLDSQTRRGSFEQAEHLLDRADGAEDEATSIIEQEASLLSPSSLIDEAMRESGLQHDAVAASAGRWLEGSEDWVRLAVAYSYCPDAQQAVPMSALAQQYGIKSYAYKVKQLGFNWREPDYRGFDGTLLGRWVHSLGVEILPENVHVIHGILKILCLEALTWAEEQESLQ